MCELRCECKNTLDREFPGGLVVRILGFHCHGPGSVPGWGIEIRQAVWHGQKNPENKKTPLDLQDLVQKNDVKYLINNLILITC